MCVPGLKATNGARGCHSQWGAELKLMIGYPRVNGFGSLSKQWPGALV